MQRIVLHIEYEGTGYCGWQVQKNGTSIQQKIGDAIFKRTGETIFPEASGRTDAGVHALCQVAHFDTQSGIPPEKFAVALNTALPGDIRIKRSFLAEEGFHARFSAKGKQYRYVIQNAPVASAIMRNFCMFFPMELDISAMREGAAHMLGTHDFSAFCAAGTDIKGTVRTVDKIELARDGEYITINVFGGGFLYNMVRIMTGTLLLVGQRKILPGDVAAIVAGKERKHAGPTVPPGGLYLVRVFY
ncbi:MAG: tRNA pseudouridine(38-40) synthase TruA [Christensenellaceae bacterium]|jgi:tRNA pseudouridine38-40 synthase